MMKSQLMVRIFSRKTNRHVSPISRNSVTLKLDSKSGWYDTFRHAVDWAECLVDSARADSTRTGDYWTSTHLTTLQVIVKGPPAIGDLEHVITTELNGSGLVLLFRYVERFARQCRFESRVPPESGAERPYFSKKVLRDLLNRRAWLSFNYSWIEPNGEIFKGGE